MNFKWDEDNTVYPKSLNIKGILQKFANTDNIKFFNAFEQ